MKTIILKYAIIFFILASPSLSRNRTKISKL